MFIFMFKLTSGKLLTGLDGTGNKCYRNAVLQILVNTPTIDLCDLPRYDSLSSQTQTLRLHLCNLQTLLNSGKSAYSEVKEISDLVASISGQVRFYLDQPEDPSDFLYNLSEAAALPHFGPTESKFTKSKPDMILILPESQISRLNVQDLIKSDQTVYYEWPETLFIAMITTLENLKNYKSILTIPDFLETPQGLYQLFGKINNHGGHYSSSILHEGDWWTIDGKRISHGNCTSEFIPSYLIYTRITQ
jgi:hypothetical protein